jgi:hypothetical protein
VQNKRWASKEGGFLFGFRFWLFLLGFLCLDAIRVKLLLATELLLTLSIGSQKLGYMGRRSHGSVLSTPSNHAVRARRARQIGVGRPRLRRGGAGSRSQRRRIGRACGLGGTAPLGWGVVEVDEGGWATGLARLARGGVALADEPEPRGIVDDLGLLARVELLTHLDRSGVLLVPLAKVDKDAPELIALLAGLRNHVDALHKPELQAVEDGANPLLADVLEDAGDAHGVDDRLGVALGAVLLGALLAGLLATCGRRGSV